MEEREQRQMIDCALEMGIELTPERAETMGLFLDELCEWSKKTNLTGISSRDRIIKELLLDSLVPLSYIPEQGSILDLGSGAGFPIIPIKICRMGLNTHLMEANNKKVNFLKHVIRLTGLSGINVKRGRIETDGDLLDPAGYDIITARAVAPLEKVIRWCAPHLKQTGLMINFQGGDFAEAIKKSSKIMRKTGIFLHEKVSYDLPQKGAKRHTLLFKKH